MCFNMGSKAFQVCAALRLETSRRELFRRMFNMDCNRFLMCGTQGAVKKQMFKHETASIRDARHSKNCLSKGLNTLGMRSTQRTVLTDVYAWI